MNRNFSSFQSALKNLQQQNPQKLSFIYIEQAVYHRIQIQNISNIYKLNVKIKKPIILSLHGYPVLKYIIEHSESLSSILQMENIHELKLSVPGYGIFNQIYELEEISSLLSLLAEYGPKICEKIKRVTLEFPGWRTFSNDVINNIFAFVRKCEELEEFSLNMNHAMNLLPKVDKNDEEEEIFYNKRLFKTEQFELLMNSISGNLPKGTLSKLELRFGAWQGIDSIILEILSSNILKMESTLTGLKVLKVDLHGWGSFHNTSLIQQQKVDKFFRIIEEVDSDFFELLEIDLRYWQQKYNIRKYKQKFEFYSGAVRKDDIESGGSDMQRESFIGANFYGSQMKSKMLRAAKIVIKI